MLRDALPRCPNPAAKARGRRNGWLGHVPVQPARIDIGDHHRLRAYDFEACQAQSG